MQDYYIEKLVNSNGVDKKNVNSMGNQIRVI